MMRIIPIQPVSWRRLRRLTFCPTQSPLSYLRCFRSPSSLLLNSHSANEDLYNILEVEYDATDDKIRLNYRKLALKWHPDKHKGDAAATAKFQEINEAYKVLSDPVKKLEYDLSGDYEIHKYTLTEYLDRFKGMILSSNGLGIDQTSLWSEQLMGAEESSVKTAVND